MEINEAYRILQLPTSATKEEIDRQFKKLSLDLHPDHGGEEKDFIALSDAKELALMYLSNKSLIVVAQHLVNQELMVLQRTADVNEQIRIVINRKERLQRGRLQRLKEMTLFLAFISGFFALIGSIKGLPIFEQFKLKHADFLYLVGAASGGFFLLLNFFTNRLKDKIDELKDLFDNKEEMYLVLSEIFDQTTIQEVEREEIYDLIKKRYLSDASNPLKSMINANVFFFNNSSISSFVRLIGYRDFGQLLILKGVSNKQLEEIEIIGNSLKLKYKLQK